MSKPTLVLTETDEAGNVVATYYQTSTDERNATRIDRIVPEGSQKSLKTLLDIFLPSGYPNSVTEDYLPYVVSSTRVRATALTLGITDIKSLCDSLQAFSSSIAGLLANRAVLEGQYLPILSIPLPEIRSVGSQSLHERVGVGDASASATNALLLSILQESLGRVATIFFAHRFGNSLEPECKLYRLLADIFNDAAMVLDCLSPVFPKPMRVMILASGSVLRSLCGVAAGSSKASLSAHFARWGNLGELNAKDSSQETVISLLGMLVGCLVVKTVNTPFATWTTLLLLLTLHLATNYMAVRSVCMRTLNRQRANIVFAYLLEYDRVLSPKQVSAKERIFEHGGILRDADGKCLGYCKIGVPACELLERLGSTDRLTRATNIPDGRLLLQLVELFEDERYIVYLGHPPSDTTCILLKKGSDTTAQLKAWYHALLLARQTEQGFKGRTGRRSKQGSVKQVGIWRRQRWRQPQARGCLSRSETQEEHMVIIGDHESIQIREAYLRVKKHVFHGFAEDHRSVVVLRFCVSGDESVRAQGMRRRCCCPSSPGPEVKGPAIRSATHGRYNNEQRAVMMLSPSSAAVGCNNTVCTNWSPR
ncbi:DUF647-domain-containing protein, partial [Aureobasidium melanogenum]